MPSHHSGNARLLLIICLVAAIFASVSFAEDVKAGSRGISSLEELEEKLQVSARPDRVILTSLVVWDMTK